MGASSVGILGGTFDPVHVGHLVAAVNVLTDLELEKVLLVVANQPWQKVGTRPVTPAEDRFALVEAAVEGYEGLEASRIEIERGGTSYTADTVAELSEIYPGAELHLVIGADVAPALPSWVRLEEVRRAVTLVVVNRPGTRLRSGKATAALAGFKVKEVEIPGLEISSTDLRERAEQHRPLDFLVPEGAIRLIEERNLYGGRR